MTIGIVIFAKFPRPGFAKTRLAAEIGNNAAANLAQAMLQDALLKVSASGMASVVFFTPATDEAAMGALLPKGPRLEAQIEGDLGARMHHAFEVMQRRGFTRIVLIGTDCPLLPQDALTEAADRLREKHDMVLLPTLDGGYGLIGLQQSRKELFDGIPWSTADVLLRQTAQAERCGYRVSLLAPTFDIDEIADLKALAAALAANPAFEAPYTRAALAAITL